MAAIFNAQSAGDPLHMRNTCADARGGDGCRLTTGWTHVCVSMILMLGNCGSLSAISCGPTLGGCRTARCEIRFHLASLLIMLQAGMFIWQMLFPSNKAAKAKRDEAVKYGIVEVGGLAVLVLGARHPSSPLPRCSRILETRA
jgi:hypothetical protein